MTSSLASSLIATGSRDHLAVQEVTVHYHRTATSPPAISQVTFSLRPQQSLCIIGASGSGKTTLFRALLGILPRRARMTGKVLLPGGSAMTAGDRATIRDYRRRSLGAIFQDAPGSLIPGVHIGRQLQYAYRLRRGVSVREARRLSRAALEQVGFPNPDDVWHKQPSALSGGMCQRCMIALALGAPQLRLLCADEPLNSLDAVSAGHVLQLLLRLTQERGAALLFIAHDVRLVSRFDLVGVLSDGVLVEFQESAAFLMAPRTAVGSALLEASRSLGRI